MAAVMAGRTIATGEQTVCDVLETMRSDIVRYGQRRVGADQAEEIFGDVQLAALRADRSGREVTPAWVMTVTRNKVIDHWRRTERESKLMEKLRGECPAFEAEESAGGFGEAAVTLGKLRPRYRSILVRHYVHGHPVGDMAACDGTTYRAMESAMSRARDAFRHHHAHEVQNELS